MPRVRGKASERNRGGTANVAVRATLAKTDKALVPEGPLLSVVLGHVSDTGEPQQRHPA